MSNKPFELKDVASLCKRRGFIFQSSEIYGGTGSCYDYGPLGVELKNNIKRAWWEEMTMCQDNIVGLDSAILMHPTVWKASGHVDTFTDPLVDCKKCKQRFREDQIEDKCPSCGGELTEPRNFNLMFKTFMGPVEGDASVAYLRPETAQGIYVNFLNVQSSSRKKLPFGICQIGKAFRNEITPGNFIFRTLEFEQMEMQYFVAPGEDDKWMDFWKENRVNYYDKLGIKKENLRFHEHGEKDLAHYAKAAFDIEYKYPIGWQELEGIHNRTDFDLKRHAEYSKKNLNYVDQEKKENYIPYIIETSAGCDRSFLAVLCDAYDVETDDKGAERVVLRFTPKLAPVKIAFLPLSRKGDLPEIAKKLHDEYKFKYNSQYDEKVSIGKRYRRQDEIGTPLCVTIDFDTAEDNAVTVRDRDTMEQKRVSIDKLSEYFSNYFI
jgi:glycyl-tRNA synthetase